MGDATNKSQLQHRPDGPALIGVEIFKAGTFQPSNFDGGDFTVTTELMDRIIASYDPAKIEAFVNIDHVHGGPSLGWVERVYRMGETLCADLRQVSWELIDALRTGAFKKRSVEISGVSPDSNDEPYLIGLSFLGANQPAVSGLADIVLSAATAGRLCFSSPSSFDPARVRIAFPAATNFQAMPPTPSGGAPMPEPNAPAPTDNVTISRSDFEQFNQLRAKCAEQDSLLAAMKAEIDNLQSNAITASTNAKRADFAAAYEAAHAKLAVDPKEKPELEADFAAALDADLAVFNAARAADPKAPVKFALADREIAKLARRAPLAHAVNFQAPAGRSFVAGAQADPAGNVSNQKRVHAKALELMAQNTGMNYAAALPKARALLGVSGFEAPVVSAS